jgi:hypothetical protein
MTQAAAPHGPLRGEPEGPPSATRNNARVHRTEPRPRRSAAHRAQPAHPTRERRRNGARVPRIARREAIRRTAPPAAVAGAMRMSGVLAQSGPNARTARNALRSVRHALRSVRRATQPRVPPARAKLLARSSKGRRRLMHAGKSLTRVARAAVCRRTTPIVGRARTRGAVPAPPAARTLHDRQSGPRRAVHRRPERQR